MTRGIRFASAAALLWAAVWPPAGASEPSLTVPPHLHPVVVASPVPDVPSCVLVEARFSRVVAIGDGDTATVYLEFRPPGDAAGDARWHAIWFRPCEPNDVVAGFVAANLPAGELLQIALPVNPPEHLRRQLTTKCQSGGQRTPAEAEGYATSLFATNLQTLRGDDAGVYLGGSLNSFVRLGRLRELRTAGA